jgi:hypothetical protein
MPPGLIVFGFFCLVIAGGIVLSRIPEQPPEAGPARLVRITQIQFHMTHVSAFAVLTLRGEDGSIGRDGVPTGRLTCRVGDVVPARKVGVFLRLAGEARRRPLGRVGNAGPFRFAKPLAAVKMPDANQI